MRFRKLNYVMVLAAAFALCLFYATWSWIRKQKQLKLCGCYEDGCSQTGGLFNSDHQAGRSQTNGVWFSQTQPFHLYVYSAFYDNRRTLRSEPQLAVISVLESRIAEQYLWCHVVYHHHGPGERTEDIVVRADPIAVGAGVVVAGEIRLQEHVVTCPLTTDLCAPDSVALMWGHGPDERTRFYVPVEKMNQSAQGQGELAVCVAASYENVNPHQITEWLEMQAILGVELVVIYNHSLSERAGRVFLEYTRSRLVGDKLGSRVVNRPLVELRQSNSFLRTAQDIALHLSPTINDCIYRHAGAFRYFAVIDLDEVIVPRHRRTLPALISNLPQTSRPTGSFVFQNAYFFLDLAVDDLHPGSHEDKVSSIYLTHQRRLYPSKVGYSAKSIVDADACIAMHNHYCWVFAPLVLSRGKAVVDVDPSVALLHHYKRCHLDIVEQQGHPGLCQSAMQSSVVDDVMSKYRSALVERLAVRYAQLNLTRSQR